MNSIVNGFFFFSRGNQPRIGNNSCFGETQQGKPKNTFRLNESNLQERSLFSSRNFRPVKKIRDRDLGQSGHAPDEFIQ